MDCYESEYEPIERAEEGVHLEHLIASVQGVEIAYAENGMKRVQWSEKREFETGKANNKAILDLVNMTARILFYLKFYFIRIGPTIGNSTGSVGSRTGGLAQNISKMLFTFFQNHSSLPSSLWAAVSCS